MNKTKVALAAAVAMSVALTVSAASPKGKQLLAQADAFAAERDAPVAPLYRALFLEGERNAVLNLNRLGLAAMESGDVETAERAFDAAILRIETIYANNPEARKARGLFSAEKVKDFKGEPYERAMTYLYRGLLYSRAGDLENARASFLASEQQSMLGESEEYQSTFGLSNFLAAWASGCSGDAPRAEELRQRAASVQPQPFAAFLTVPAHLMLVDVGVGPKKVGSGKYNEKLTFEPVGATPSQVEVAAAAARVDAVAVGADLNWQAMTRGGRPIDAILAGKAQWKASTTATSNAVATAGYYTALQGAYSGNSDVMNAGGIAMATGLLGNLVGRAMTPSADLRAWDGLPAAIVVGTFAPGPVGTTGPLTLRSADSGSPVEMLAPQRFGTAACSITWARTQSSIPLSAQAVSNPDIQERNRGPANSRWRDFLLETFPQVRVTDASAVVTQTGAGAAQ
jgi:tetratricopeptide (TPR) repeat protein